MPETRVAANDVGPPGEDAVTLAPLELGTVWNLRGDPANSAFVAEAARVLGLPLPLAPNASARDERGPSLLMLGPRSWLFVARHDAVRNDFDTARQRLNGAGGALFDVSASYVGWSVAGSDAARVLNRGCPLDLDPRVFPPAIARRACSVTSAHSSIAPATRRASSSWWHGASPPTPGATCGISRNRSGRGDHRSVIHTGA